MSAKAAQNEHDVAENEVERRRDNALRRALSTPPQPKQDSEKRESESVGREPKREKRD